MDSYSDRIVHESHFIYWSVQCEVVDNQNNQEEESLSKEKGTDLNDLLFPLLIEVV